MFEINVFLQIFSSRKVLSTFFTFKTNFVMHSSYMTIQISCCFKYSITFRTCSLLFMWNHFITRNLTHQNFRSIFYFHFSVVRMIWWWRTFISGKHYLVSKSVIIEAMLIAINPWEFIRQRQAVRPPGNLASSCRKSCHKKSQDFESKKAARQILGRDKSWLKSVTCAIPAQKSPPLIAWDRWSVSNIEGGGD